MSNNSEGTRIGIKASTSEGSRLTNFSLLLLFLGLLAASFSDLSIYASSPWQQLSLLMQGLTSPTITNWSDWRDAIIATLAFAILGVTLGGIAGFILSLLFRSIVVRSLCALCRAIHELFWALIFMQIFGLSAITGILAIAVPFACIFARVFNDIYQQASIRPIATSHNGRLSLSYFIYILMPQIWPKMKDYIGYRLECAVRTSTVLGFIGLPTLGFYLETTFKEANYSASATLIFSLLAIILSIKYWFRLKYLPFYTLLAWFLIPTTPFNFSVANITRFFGTDIWPQIPSNQSYLLGYFQWANQEMITQGWSGIINTLLLTLMAVALTWLLTLFIMPWLAKTNNVRPLKITNNSILLCMRSIPEYVLAFVLLLLFGPSMLPAVIALAIHNSGLIGFLMNQRITRENRLKSVTSFAKNNGKNSSSLSQFLYYMQPNLYPGFLSLLLYRAEIILRESAILGMLGITTLGFYIDSAFEDFRLDRAFLLLMVTALLNIVLDWMAQKVQIEITHQPIKVQSR